MASVASRSWDVVIFGMGYDERWGYNIDIAHVINNYWGQKNVSANKLVYMYIYIWAIQLIDSLIGLISSFSKHQWGRIDFHLGSQE